MKVKQTTEIHFLSKSHKADTFCLGDDNLLQEQNISRIKCSYCVNLSSRSAMKTSCLSTTVDSEHTHILYSEPTTIKAGGEAV